MKKIEYQAPEMEVVELKYTQSLLSYSTGESTGGGAEEVEPGTPAD